LIFFFRPIPEVIFQNRTTTTNMSSSNNFYATTQLHPTYDFDDCVHFLEKLELWGSSYKDGYSIMNDTKIITPYDNDTKELVRLYHINPTVKTEIKKYCDYIIKYNDEIISEWKKTSHYAPYKKKEVFVKELNRRRQYKPLHGHFWVEADGEIVDPEFVEYESVKKINKLTDTKMYKHLPEYRNEMINKYINPILDAIELSKMSRDEFLNMIRTATDNKMYKVDNCPVNCVVKVMILELQYEKGIETRKDYKIQYGNFGWMDKNGNPFYEYEDDRTYDAFNDNTDKAFHTAVKELRAIFKKRNTGKPLNKNEKSSLIAMGITPEDFKVNNYLFGKDYKIDGGANLNKKSKMGIAFDKTTGINKNVGMNHLPEFNRKEKIIEHLRNMKKVKDTREELKKAQKYLLK